jgi:hypothetical protein
MSTITSTYSYQPLWETAAVEQSSMLAQLPQDIFSRIVSISDSTCLNSLFYSSKMLLKHSFYAITQDPTLLSKACSKLLAMQDMQALERFVSICQNCIQNKKLQILDLDLYFPVEDKFWDELPQALLQLQELACINSIAFHGRNWLSSSIDLCLKAVPSLKSATFIGMHDFDFELFKPNLDFKSSLQNIQQLHFRCVDFKGLDTADDFQTYPLTHILTFCPKLKKLTFSNCYALCINMHEHRSSDTIEFFSCKKLSSGYFEGRGNLAPRIPYDRPLQKSLLAIQKTKDSPSPQTGIGCYFLACSYLNQAPQPYEYNLIKAKMLLRESIQKSPQLANPKALLGKLLAEEANSPLSIQEAKTLLEESLAIVPTYPLAQLGLGILFFKEEKNQEAYTLLDTAAKQCMQEYDLDLLLEIARLFQTNDRAKSRSIFDYFYTHAILFDPAGRLFAITGKKQPDPEPDDSSIYSLEGIIELCAAAKKGNVDLVRTLYEKIEPFCDNEAEKTFIIGFADADEATLRTYVEKLENIDTWKELFLTAHQKGHDSTSVLALFLMSCTALHSIHEEQPYEKVIAMHQFLCEVRFTKERKFFTELALWNSAIGFDEIVKNILQKTGDLQEIQGTHSYYMLNFYPYIENDDKNNVLDSFRKALQLDGLPSQLRCELLKTILENDNPKEPDMLEFSVQLAELLLSKDSLRWQTRKAERIFQYIIAHDKDNLEIMKWIYDRLSHHNILPDEQKRLKELLVANDYSFLELFDARWFETL